MCILRYRKTKLVPYSYEHGGGDLLPLKDLVSDKEDPEKSRILSYLNTNCISACPGIVHDEINPELDAGCGNMYSDGTYTWTDTFIVYVDRYNIPVPEDFRNHILENFKERQKRQVLFRLIDEIEIENNPLTGYHYKIKINKK